LNSPSHTIRDAREIININVSGMRGNNRKRRDTKKIVEQKARAFKRPERIPRERESLHVHTMQRLKLSGTRLTSPGLARDELASALKRLGACDAFNDAEVEDIYTEIAVINGIWASNEEGKEGPETAKALLGIAKSSDPTSAALRGHETGFHSTAEIQATSLIAQSLAPGSRPGEPAQELIEKFRQNPRRIVEAATAARRKLREKSGRNGRDRLIWYDRFAQLLLDIAKKAKLEPTLGNDDANGVPCGWLFRAARELEAFFHPHMRSPSATACGKRLSRSLARLGQRR
jgi:hypothetical protein